MWLVFCLVRVYDARIATHMKRQDQCHFYIYIYTLYRHTYHTIGCVFFALNLFDVWLVCLHSHQFIESCMRSFIHTLRVHRLIMMMIVIIISWWCRDFEVTWLLSLSRCVPFGIYRQIITCFVDCFFSLDFL